MWFLNKETGLKWEVTDEELINRLLKNGHYEEVKEDKVGIDAKVKVKGKEST